MMLTTVDVIFPELWIIPPAYNRSTTEAVSIPLTTVDVMFPEPWIIPPAYDRSTTEAVSTTLISEPSKVFDIHLSMSKQLVGVVGRR